MYLQKIIIQGRATTMHLGSRQHYLDIIVCDIKGDIVSNSGWDGGDSGVEEEEEEEDKSVKKTGAGFLFWYSQTVFIFLCIYCLESNLVNFYSS